MKKFNDFGKGIVVGIVLSFILTVIGSLLISYFQWEMLLADEVFSLEGFSGVWWRICVIFTLICGIIMLKDD